MTQAKSQTNLFKKVGQTINVIYAGVTCFLLGSNLATLALLTSPSRALMYVQYVLFGWRMAVGQGLRQRQFHELFPTPAHVCVSMLPGIGYLTQWDANYTKDMLYLALLARVLAPKTIFEIGTLQGYTALLFSLNSPSDASVYTLDLPPSGSVSSALKTTIMDDLHIQGRARTKDYMYLTDPAGAKVKQLYGDSAVFDFSDYDRKIDLFFIDGAHSYEYVRSDTLRALSCLRPGGVIVWHDYGRWGVNGVSKWLHELAASGREVYRLPGSSLAILVAREP